MPDRPRARVLITALLILLTVAGIRAIGPGGDWGRHASDVLVVGLALEAVLAGLIVGLRWRRAPREALAARLNKLVMIALSTSMFLVAIIIILAVYNKEPTAFGKPHLPNIAHHRARTPVGLHKFHLSTAGHGGLIRDVLVALLIIAIAAILFTAWLRRRRTPSLGEVPDLSVDEAGADLARAVESGRAALLELSDARRAIIACYAAMERSLAEAGAERAAAETPGELLGRAVEAGLVPHPPAQRLTTLFYEARYSTHDMPDSQRAAAEQALTDIAAVLPVGDPA